MKQYSLSLAIALVIVAGLTLTYAIYSTGKTNNINDQLAAIGDRVMSGAPKSIRTSSSGSIDTLTISPTPLVRGQPARIEWTTNGGIQACTIEALSNSYLWKIAGSMAGVPKTGNDSITFDVPPSNVNVGRGNGGTSGYAQIGCYNNLFTLDGANNITNVDVEGGYTYRTVPIVIPGGSSASSVTLTVTKSGGIDQDTVTGSGINCGSTCSTTVSSGTTVTLTATPAQGSTFSSWSGCTSSDGTSCNVGLSTNATVTANFVSTSFTSYPLTITKTGSTGQGTISGNGINCGSTCLVSLDAGTPVSLTATPASGSYFMAWQGTGGTNPTYSFTMPSSATNIEAYFVITPTITLTVTATQPTSATLTWKDQNETFKAKAGTYFKIERATSPSGPFTSLSIPWNKALNGICPDGTASPCAPAPWTINFKATNNNLTPNTTYYYRVTRYGNPGCIAFGCPATVTTSVVSVTTPSGSDTTPPTVSLTAPSNNATVSGAAVAISATASDDTGVLGVTFMVDGAIIGTEDTTSPYSVSWNTTIATNDTHIITATARDAAGNRATSTRTVTVSNHIVEQWVKSFGSTDTDMGKATVVDASGSVIVTGRFKGTVDFGGTSRTSAGGYDIFLAKYNSAGALQWVTGFGGIDSEDVYSMALDHSGNIFISGLLGSTTGSLAKFNSQGSLLWTAGPKRANFARRSTDSANFVSIATDSQGNILVTGDFRAQSGGEMDFGDGWRIYAPQDSVNAFLAKYSSSGSCLLARDFDNFGDTQKGTGIAVDTRINPSTGLAYDDVYLVGFASSAIDIGGGFLQNNNHDVGSVSFGFLGKYSSNGTYIWGRRVGTNLVTDNTTVSSRGQKLVIDGIGDVIVGGDFNTHTNVGGELMDSGNVMLSGTSGMGDFFLVKYSGVTGSHIWSQAIKSVVNGYGVIGRVTVDTGNNVFIVGNMNAYNSPAVTTTFGTTAQGVLVQISIPYPNTDCYVAKYSSAGVALWVRQLNTASGSVYSVATDSTNHPVITGTFSGSATIAGQTLSSQGGYDAFVGRLNP